MKTFLFSDIGGFRISFNFLFVREIIFFDWALNGLRKGKLSAGILNRQIEGKGLLARKSVEKWSQTNHFRG